MSNSFIFQNVSQALPTLASYVMSGPEIGSRLGDRTRERLSTMITLRKPWEREILHPARKANLAAQIAETVWVLSGRDDITWLSHYLPRAKDFSDDGKTWRGAYGPRLRAWGAGHRPVTSEGFSEEPIDQLEEIRKLLDSDRSSRRAVVSIYDPQIDLTPGKDIPCNDFLQFLNRDGRLHLNVVIRSNDLMWGWSGINAFEWSALQEIMAGMLGLLVGPLTFFTGSLHLYDRHWERGEAMARVPSAEPPMPRPSPLFSRRRGTTWRDMDVLFDDWFQTEKMLREHPWNVEANIAFVEEYPEDMLASWLWVIGWWWSSDPRWLDGLMGTPLYYAALKSPGQPSAPDHPAPVPVPTPEPIVVEQPSQSFSEYVAELHRAKHEAYGDSWKKRGEVFSILPNIARKLDRISTGAATPDESQTDTLIDLLVYLIKYLIWIQDNYEEDWPRWFGLTAADNTGTEPERVARYLKALDSWAGVGDSYPERLSQQFEVLLKKGRVKRRAAEVASMIQKANALARRAWMQDHGDINTEAANQ